MNNDKRNINQGITFYTFKKYLKNSLECTALEVRKYQTGFLGLLRMVWRVVFPLASWKISKNHVFSTRFMEKRIFPYNDLPFLALANLATQLEKWLFRVQLFVVPICNQMHLIFFLTNSIVDRIFLYQSCLSLPTIWKFRVSE